MVFITGDCHGDFRRFGVNKFRDQKEMTKDDTVIICGDFGLWHDTKEERYWLDWLEDKPFTTVFVDGNHENFDRLCGMEFDLGYFHGACVQKIRPSVLHVLRGGIFELEGKSFFCFGGAKSHDIKDGILDPIDFENYKAFSKEVHLWQKQGKQFRVNHYSWWEQELPRDYERISALRNLIFHNNKVDYIITHCCPQEVASLCGFHDPDLLTQWFNMIAHTVEFRHWYFGHYHDDRDLFGKFHMRYERVERVL